MAIDFGPLQTACRETFGETVSYTPNGGVEVEVTAIYNERSTKVGDDFEIIAHRPNLGIKSADLDDPPAVGDAVEVRGTTYRVSDVEDDGEGMHIVYLQKTT